MRTARVVLWSLLAPVGAAFVCLTPSCVGDEPSIVAADASSSTDGSSPNVDATSLADVATVDGTTPSEDGGLDAGVDALDAAPFRPSDLGAKLVLWFESSPANYTLADGKVTVWNDLSSFGSNALMPAQGAGPVPVLPDASAPIQGHEPLLFGGENVFLRINDGPNLQWGTRDFAIFAVIRASSAPIPIYDKNEKGTFGHYGHVSFRLENDTVVAEISDIDGGVTGQIATPNPIMADNAYHLLGLRRYAQTNLELRVDTNIVGPAALAPTNLDLSSADGVTFGGYPYVAGPLRFWDARFLEMVVLESTSGTVPDSDVTAVEAYLKAKYGL